MRASLAGRLTMLALGQLVLIALVAVGIAHLTRPPAPRDFSAAVHEAARELAEGELSPERVTAIGAAHDLDLDVYPPGGRAEEPGTEGDMLGPEHDPPFVVFGPGPFDEPHAQPTVELPDGWILGARPARPPPQYRGPFLTLLAAALVLGLGGVLTARWIVRPLSALHDAAVAITEGDRTARAGLRRNDELGDVARAFDTMVDRMEVARLAEREMLANVSHELRTPLARLRVALELAEEGHASGRAALADAAVDLGELESIVESILSAMRMEQSETFEFGLPMNSLRDVALGELLNEARDRFAMRHPNRPLTLDVASDLPPVMVDPLLLRRVIENLLENAHKYSPDPSSPIRVHAEELDAQTLELRVIDRGMGIEASDLDRVFEPFFRAERSRSRKAGGVGLGLTLCKRIVQAHGGSIALESPHEAGRPRGTTVRVRLPTGHLATDTDGHRGDKVA